MRAALGAPCGIAPYWRPRARLRAPSRTDVPSHARRALTMTTPPITDRLSDALAEAWWLVLLRGIAALVFGILTLLQPEASVAVLLLFFAAYAIVDGVIGIWTAVANRQSQQRWWVLLLWGTVSVLAGVLALVAPAAVVFGVVITIAFWAIFTGVLQIAAAIRLRQEMTGEWVLIAAGALSVLFGALVLLQPALGLLSIMWLVAAYAILFGILLIALAFKLRRKA